LKVLRKTSIIWHYKQEKTSSECSYNSW